VAYLHGVFASCPLSTFLYALRAGWLGNYPKIIPLMVEQNPPVARATFMGYLDQTRQGQRFTKGKRRQISRRPGRKQAQVPSSTGNIDDSLLFHIQDASDTPHLCFQDITSTEFMNSSDATGKFSFLKLSGWNYILVFTLKGYVLLSSYGNAQHRSICVRTRQCMPFTQS
jgi:hypothetical protein